MTQVIHEPKTLRQRAMELSQTMQCNCDLDNWEPERSTGHSHVCRIHKVVIAEFQQHGGLKIA